MWIDILLLVTLLLGLWKGWRQGFIISIFSMLAWIFGVLGAFRLSNEAAQFLNEHQILASKYTPVLAFILVFILIAIIIYLIGKALEKVIETVQLGFINRSLGAVLRVMIYVFVLSLFIWLINQGGLISPGTKAESKSYDFLAHLSDRGIELMAQYLPFVKEIFSDAAKLFDEMTKPSSSLMNYLYEYDPA